jgi:hypothetical protein
MRTPAKSNDWIKATQSLQPGQALTQKNNRKQNCGLTSMFACLFQVKILLILLVLLSTTAVAAVSPFRQLCTELIASAGESSVVRGVSGWLFLKEELQHLAAGRFWGEDAANASRAKNKKYPDPLPAILAYNKLLAEKGITLYLMPVPPKALVYSEMLADGVDPAIAGEDQQLYEEFFSLLEKNGVKTIDLLPTLLQNSSKAKLYCKTDSHYSGLGLVYFAKAAAQQLSKQSWYQGIAKTGFVRDTRKISIKGDLQQMLGEEGPGEELQLSVVSLKDSQEPLQSNPKSPVILLGDSHTLVFSAGGDLHAKGAGLFDNLSAELGFAVDLLGVRGSGITPARIQLYQRSKKDADYLKGKKALIWCFAARDFSGTGGWREIPVAP